MKANSKIIAIFNYVMIAASIVVSIVYFFIFLKELNGLMMMASVLAVFFTVLGIPIIEKILKCKLSEDIKLGYYVFIFLSAVLGMVGDMYEHISWYDNVVHLGSGFLAAAFGILIYRYLKGKEESGNKNIIDVFVLGFGSLVALLWEVCEYVTDLLFIINAQKGNVDTMQDVLYGLLGTIIYLLIYNSKGK